MSYKRFVASDRVDKELQRENRRGVRRLLVNICEFDPTFSTGEFDDALEYVCKIKGVDIYDPFEAKLNPLYGNRVSLKDSTLQKNDFIASVAYLLENFCPERIEDTKKLGRYLFPEEMHQSKTETQLRQQSHCPSGATPREIGASYKSSSTRAEPNPPKSGHAGKVWPLAVGIAAAAVLIYLLIK